MAAIRYFKLTEFWPLRHTLFKHVFSFSFHNLSLDLFSKNLIKKIQHMIFDMSVNKLSSSVTYQGRSGEEPGERVLRDMKEARVQEESLREIRQQLEQLAQSQDTSVSSKRRCFS